MHSEQISEFVHVNVGEVVQSLFLGVECSCFEIEGSSVTSFTRLKKFTF